ncbi:Nucleotidyltransferase, partial [Ceratobasidium sp. AG-I]
AIRSITNHTTKITSVDQAARLAGVGTNIAEKIHEFIFTGRVSKIAAQTTEDLAVTRLFQGIYGVGPQTAYSWYVRGLRTLADVRNRMGGIALSNSQVLGLEYYSDLQRRMPRSEAAEIFERIKAVALELDPKLDIEIMGSFRRGKATCGDIDILITRSTTDGGSHRGLLRKLLPILHGRKLVTHDLSSPDDDNELEAKYMGLCQLHSDTLMRRIDILTIPCDQWGAALLYFTGDDLFNRSMRLLARKKGMSLNQRGLFEGVIRDPKTQNKLGKGEWFLVASRTEREIFERLKVPWREPHERVINA